MFDMLYIHFLNAKSFTRSLTPGFNSCVCVCFFLPKTQQNSFVMKIYKITEVSIHILLNLHYWYYLPLGSPLDFFLKLIQSFRIRNI